MNNLSHREDLINKIYLTVIIQYGEILLHVPINKRTKNIYLSAQTNNPSILSEITEQELIDRGISDADIEEICFVVLNH